MMRFSKVLFAALPKDEWWKDVDKFSVQTHTEFISQICFIFKQLKKFVCLFKGWIAPLPHKSNPFRRSFLRLCQKMNGEKMLISFQFRLTMSLFPKFVSCANISKSLYSQENCSLQNFWNYTFSKPGHLSGLYKNNVLHCFMIWLEIL